MFPYPSAGDCVGTDPLCISSSVEDTGQGALRVVGDGPGVLLSHHVLSGTFKRMNILDGRGALLNSVRLVDRSILIFDTSGLVPGVYHLELLGDDERTVVQAFVTE